MKKTIRSTLICSVFFLLASQNFAQIVTAKAQQVKKQRSVSEKQEAKEKKLKDVLNELKDHYNVDILFFDRYVDYTVPADAIQWNKTIEKNLEEILRSTNLEFKKTKKGGFVISPKKMVQVESLLNNDNGLTTEPTDAQKEENNVLPENVTQPAGTVQVTGTVKDDSGQPLPGANILEKGTSNGTITDSEGAFKINVDENATLVFSFVGFKSQEISVSGRTVVDVVMQLDATELQEVTVSTGYGEMRKADVTSAMTTISSKDVNRTINTTFDQAIQGRAAGVYVTQNTGTPGGGVSVNIRGVNSLNGTNEPLYVIDGVQVQGGTSTTGTNPMSMLNPSDIENFEILQGPNATAIYGSRGTNGVVIITTKRGKSGDTKINYSYTFGLQDRPKNLDVMNLRQFAQMQVAYKTLINDQAGIRDEFRDPSLLGSGSDWQHALFQQAAMQKHQLSFSGGNDKTTYYLSGERMMQDGVALNSGFNRTSVRLNLDNKVRKWLTVGTNFTVTQTDQKLGTMATTSTWNNLILNAIQLGPDIPVRNADGTYGAGQPSVSTTQQYTPPNPVGLANIVTNNQTNRTLLGGAYVAVQIIKGLEFRTNFNTNIGYSNSTQFYPTYYFSQYQQNPTAKLWNYANYNTYWGWNQMLTYTRDFNKHHVSAMATHEAQESNWKNLMGYRQTFPTNNIIDLNLGDPNNGVSNGGGQGAWAMESFLGRLNYNYDDRYIVTAAYRADGSSNFGPASRWGYFPSISAAYRISNEKFFQVPQINDLRLRFETGVTGSQGNGSAIYGTFNPAGASQWGTSFSPQVYPNPNFKWEQTTTNNVGLTLGVFNGRIQLDADYYVKKTNNLILQSTLPWYMGTAGASQIGAPVMNIGSLENKGWSIAITTENIRTGEFKWTSNFNISSFQTKVTALTSQSGQIERNIGQPKGNEPFIERSVVGKAPWQFVGNIYEGIFKDVNEVNNSPRPVDNAGNLLPVDPSNIWVGDAKYRDVNGDGKIDDKDLTLIGNPWPKLFGGFTNNFSYKGFELSVIITYSYGNQIYNLTRDEETNPNNINLGRNMFANTLNYAKLSTNTNDASTTLLNPGTTVPRIQGSKGLNNNFDRYTSNYVEDGSYARLKNVSLTYSLPASLIGRQKVIRAVRIGVSAQNLATITKYKGYDPEVGAYVGPSYNGDSVTSTLVGMDYGRYPLTKMYSFNIGIDF